MTKPLSTERKIENLEKSLEHLVAACSLLLVPGSGNAFQVLELQSVMTTLRNKLEALQYGLPRTAEDEN